MHECITPRLGVHVHHEGLGPDGAVSWFFAYKVQNFAINNPEPLITGRHRFCVRRRGMNG